MLGIEGIWPSVDDPPTREFEVAPKQAAGVVKRIPTFSMSDDVQTAGLYFSPLLYHCP